MARPLLIPYPENATIAEIKEVSRVGSIETATRCTAIQMLLAGASIKLINKSLLITDRALRKWINPFNQSGVDGLIVKKRPGRTAIIKPGQTYEFSELIDYLNERIALFGRLKPFIVTSVTPRQIDCSYETVVRFFHKQGYALKTPQPWSDKQDEQQRKTFLEELEQLFNQPHVDIWFADESGFEGDPRYRKRWEKKGRKTRVTKNGGHLRMNVIGSVLRHKGLSF